LVFSAPAQSLIHLKWRDHYTAPIPGDEHCISDQSNKWFPLGLLYGFFDPIQRLVGISKATVDFSCGIILNMFKKM
jgi:hypothetical protein